MLSFEVLCVTMNQTDFSKIKEMNIKSDVIFANQAHETSYKELGFDDNKAKMITTATRGVGVNRNLALAYASADICLFSDDDLVYVDNMKDLVVGEFEAHPDADIIVFNLETNHATRKQKIYTKTRKCNRFTRMPWGTFRVAFRLDSVRKANIWFTTLYGGGCIFPSGEDSMWLTQAKKMGLKFYVSKEIIGTVSFEESSWFTGYDEKFFFAKGAFYSCVHPHNFHLWMLYFAIRTHRFSSVKMSDRIKWMLHGRKAYAQMLSYENYREKHKI